MLALAKRLPAQDRLVRLGRWDLQPSVMGHEIEGRTLGIVGLGHSGRELVRLVSPFRMRVLAFSPHADPNVASACGVQLTSLEELLSESDFVSLHCSLTQERRGMIAWEQLARMKPSSYFINVARGELVDQRALVTALRERRIAGAALDVFEVEPLPLGDPLLELDNVILSPHWSASTSDVWVATAEAMARGMGRAARGQVPENLVNADVLHSSSFREKIRRFEANRQASDASADRA
jgi:phosphoglycerate dehydrogenase-like enzyme